MTTPSIIVLCGIVSTFLLFAGALAWGEYYSRRRASTQFSEPQQAPPATIGASAEWRDAA